MQTWLRSLGFRSSLAIASTSGFVQALGAPPDGWLPGHFLGLVPLIVLVRREQVDVRAAFWLGGVAGLGVGLGGFPWIAEMLVRFARVPWPIALLGLLGISAWMAIPWALFAVGLRAGPQRGALSLLWPIVLFVGLNGLWPNLFPYTPVLGFAERPELLQLAELGGVALVEAPVVGFALLVARGVMAPSSSRALRELGAAALIPPLLLGYGTLRLRAVERESEGAPVLRIGIVQPNLPIGDARGSVHMERLQGPSARAEREGAALVIWPEAGAYPYSVARPLRHDVELGPGRVLAHHRRPTVFGANTRAPGERFGWNSVYLMEADGRVSAHYDKVNLVPLGESIPLIDPDWVTRYVPQIAHHHRGEAPARFEVELEVASAPGGAATLLGVPLAPLVCYEDILPGFVREAAAQPGGVSLFVNLTIDAWYGDSAEPWEHLALAQFRSVEHRIPLVRSVSTGVSAVVDPGGRVVAHVPLRPVSDDTLDRFPPEVLVEDVALPRNTERNPTPFARGGFLLGPACSLAALLGGAWLLAQSRRHTPRAPAA